jgi:plasmid stabilization system protein ParE
MLAAIRGQTDILDRFPGVGSPFGAEGRRLRVRGTPYLLFYRTLSDRVEILRIRHDREQWDA